MTCQDCELRLAQGEMDAAVTEHLRECAECRALNEESAANASALEALRNIDLPRVEVKTPRRRRVYPWIAAAAAALIAAALLVPRTPPAPEPSTLPFALKEPAQPPEPQKLQPLKIKMLTSDPNVVIYWLIED